MYCKMRSQRVPSPDLEIVAERISAVRQRDTVQNEVPIPTEMGEDCSITPLETVLMLVDI